MNPIYLLIRQNSAIDGRCHWILSRPAINGVDGLAIDNYRVIDGGLIILDQDFCDMEICG